MKKILCLVLCLCLCWGLSVPAMAAESETGVFQKTNTYAGQFADLPDDYWGTQWAAVCYEYGLMKGTADDAFSPDGTVSVAEAIVMACRIYEIRTAGESTLANGTPWYQPYVEYAIDKGLIFEDSFSDYTLPAPRYLVAQLLYLVTPSQELTAINAVPSLPDVPSDWVYAPAIYRFYEAGILTGSDSYGSFHPTKSITRAETAAILARLVVPELRQNITLMDQFALGTPEKQVVVRFDFPLDNLVSSDGLQYSYFNLNDDSLLTFLFTANATPDSDGLSMTDCLSTEEMTQQLSSTFDNVPLTTSLLHYGDLEVYLTQLQPDSQWDSYDRMYILNFLWEGDLVTVLLAGENCPELCQQVLDSIQLLGSPLTDG